jgi:hypothetical protein
VAPLIAAADDADAADAATSPRSRLTDERNGLWDDEGGMPGATGVCGEIEREAESERYFCAHMADELDELQALGFSVHRGRGAGQKILGSR